MVMDLCLLAWMIRVFAVVMVCRACRAGRLQLPLVLMSIMVRLVCVVVRNLVDRCESLRRGISSMLVLR